MEHGNLGRRTTDATTWGPFYPKQVLSLGDLVCGLLRGLDGKDTQRLVYTSIRERMISRDQELEVASVVGHVWSLQVWELMGMQL